MYVTTVVQVSVCGERLRWGEGKKSILHEKYDISATKKEFQGISINVTFIEVL